MAKFGGTFGAIGIAINAQQQYMQQQADLQLKQQELQQKALQFQQAQKQAQVDGLALQLSTASQMQEYHQQQAANQPQQSLYGVSQGPGNAPQQGMQQQGGPGPMPGARPMQQGAPPPQMPQPQQRPPMQSGQPQAAPQQAPQGDTLDTFQPVTYQQVVQGLAQQAAQRGANMQDPMVQQAVLRAAQQQWPQIQQQNVQKRELLTARQAAADRAASRADREQDHADTETDRAASRSIERQNHADSMGIRQAMLGLAEDRAKAGRDIPSETLDYAAAQYRKDGKMPPLGFGSAARIAVLQRATEMAKEDHKSAADDLTSQAGFHSDAASLRNITKVADSSAAFEETATKNFDRALALAPKGVPTNLGPFINRWVQDGQTALGNKDVPAYVAALLTGANEYAKIMSGATGAAGSTVDSRQEAAKMFSGALNVDQIREVIEHVAKPDMQNRMDAYKEKVGDIKSRISGGASAPKEYNFDPATGKLVPK